MDCFTHIFFIVKSCKTGFTAVVKIATRTLSHIGRWAKFEMMWLWITTIRQLTNNAVFINKTDFKMCLCEALQQLAVDTLRKCNSVLDTANRIQKRCPMPTSQESLLVWCGYTDMFSFFFYLDFFEIYFFFYTVFFHQQRGSVFQKQILSAIKMWSYLWKLNSFLIYYNKILFIKYINLIKGFKKNIWRCRIVFFFLNFT